MTEPRRLLLVCLGNICRSPMAEGALRAQLAAAGLHAQVQVDSAGTGHWHIGSAPDPRAIASASRNGVDIAGLRARQLDRRDFEDFDFILCADRSTLRDARARAPDAARSRCMLMSEYADLGQIEIPDPYTGSNREFDHVWSLIERMSAAIVRRLDCR